MRAQSMSELLTIAGMFILRLGVPLIVTLLVTWMLHRLDERWRRQALQNRQLPASTALPAADPGAQPRAPVPCWGYRRCPEACHTLCPAYLAPELPCWLARLRADGRLPAGCRTCPLFSVRRIIPTATG